MAVTVTVTLARVEGRKLVFDVSARDEVEAITEGTHERFAVDFAKFNARVAKKVGGA
jgi:fluoroacetyl-CoA thioesterase